MKIILFGASGMVGTAALREALAAPEVEGVLGIGRRPCGVEHPKLKELVLPDLFDFAAVEPQLVGYDACIWAVGVSSVGLDEAAYARVTVELTLAWARALLRLNPGMSLCYVSG
ncbi:MAG: NAD-dependent epimerase/dehydratase family protein, partial [Anaeromyxobacteraceae bacterium]